MFFFMPETRYLGPRPVIRPMPGGGITVEAPESKPEVEAIENTSENTNNQKVLEPSQVERTATARSAVPKRSFLRNLALWESPDKNASLRKDLLRPFVLLTYPTILWACFIYGAALGWNVILGATTAQLFAPQYGFDPQSQGLVFLSPFIGSLVGTWLCGPTADWVANYYTKRNDGIREPEMRLPTCAIAGALVFLGALVAGLTYHYNTHWIGPLMGIGILSAGAQMGATLSMSYASDCHTEVSNYAESSLLCPDLLFVCITNSGMPAHC
jgi:hypothetical protein